MMKVMIMNCSCHINFFIYLMIIIVFSRTTYAVQSIEPSEYKFVDDDRSTSETTKTIQSHTIHRKLLFLGECTKRDISISQSTEFGPGIPQFTVEIMNTCYYDCAPRKIHLHCGEFASARMVNPLAFKRLDIDECLVNNGEPLEAGQIVRFTYSNSFMQPLFFKSAEFCHDK